ncbi:MAG: PEGA domain-containing protein [Magnetococcales bacterium]|nr:PEGA domain-containing protein [Magnetococcales bacterium]
MQRFVHTLRQLLRVPSVLTPVPASTGVLMTAGLAWLMVMAPPMPAPSSPPEGVVHTTHPEPATPTPTPTAVVTSVAPSPPVSATDSLGDTLLLRVETKPKGATIILDGQKLGTTPFTVGRVKTGMHTLRLEMDDYNPVAMDLDLTVDTVVDMTLDLLVPPPPPPTALRKSRTSEESAPTDTPNRVVASLTANVASDVQTPLNTTTTETAQSAQQQQQAEQTLLRTAEQHLKAGRLTHPKQDNAVTLFQQLQSSSPAHPRIADGIRRLTTRLLTLGREDLEAWRLLQPEENNALERFRAVLLLDSTNQTAKAGLAEIVDRLLSLAQRYAQEPDKAKTYLRQAEMILPDQPRIRELRALWPEPAAGHDAGLQANSTPR